MANHCADKARKGDAVSPAELLAAAAKLPARSVKHIFTELRKAANHPLLLCHRYRTDPAV